MNKTIVIEGYIENEPARRFSVFAQTLQVMGHIGGFPKMTIALRKYDNYTQPIKIRIGYEGKEPPNPGLKFIKEKYDLEGTPQ